MLTVALILFAGVAIASPEDDFAACLIGRAAVALPTVANDVDKAHEIAAVQCPMPEDIDGDRLDEIGRFVNVSVEAIAEAM